MNIRKLAEQLDIQAKQKLLSFLQAERLKPARPQGWRENTNAPYYKEHFALEIKDLVDEWVEHPEKDRKLFLADYNCTKNTLLQRITQSFLFLIDNLDDKEGTYKNLRARIIIIKEHDGIRLKWKLRTKDLHAQAVDPDSNAVAVWRKTLLDYLESAENEEVLLLENQNLYPEDRTWIEALVSQIPNFHILTLNNKTIKIARNDNLSILDDSTGTTTNGAGETRSNE